MIKYFIEICIFRQKTHVCFRHIWVKLVSVVSKWSQDVPLSWRCFPAHEKGYFSKNSDVLQFEGKVPFVLLMGWWG